MRRDRLGPPIDVRPLFPVERSHLLDLLSGLDPDQWDLTTCCPGWRVRDVVAHLAHDYLRRLSGHRDRHPGHPTTPGEDLPGYLARVNQDAVDAARELSPRVLVDLLATFGPQLDTLWALCDLRATGHISVWWADPEAPAPVWLDIGREYTEFWVHQQHIRDAVGLPGANEPELLNPVIDIFLRALPHTLAGTAAPAGTNVAVDVGTPVSRCWVVSRGPDGWTLDPLAPHDVKIDARVSTSAHTLWRLAAGLVTPATARAHVRLEGDPHLAAQVLEITSIIR